MKRFQSVIFCGVALMMGQSLAEDSGSKLSLAQAIERAKAEAPRLRQLASMRDSAGAGMRSAKAGHWPSLNVLAGYTRNSDVPELSAAFGGGPTVTLYPNIPDTFRTRVEADFPLFNGFRTTAAVDAARLQERAASEDFTAGEVDLILETTTGYWNLVTAIENHRVLKEALAAYDAHLKDAKNRLKVGMAATNEVLQVQVERDSAELNLIRAKNTEQVAGVNLKRLTGYSAATILEPADSLEGTLPEATPAEHLFEKALAARPERAALRARLESSEALVGFQRGGWWPRINAVGGYDYSNPNRKIFPATEEFKGTWDVGVNLTMNLFEGGRTTAGIDQAKAQAEAYRQQLKDVDQRIRFDVESHLMNLSSALAAVPVAERNVEAAKENVAVAKNRYRSGVIPSSELLDAETGLLRAGLLKADVLAQVRIAKAELSRAVGE